MLSILVIWSSKLLTLKIIEIDNNKIGHDISLIAKTIIFNK